MPLRMDLWQVNGGELLELPAGHLDVEERLEDWIYADPGLVGMDLMRIGRQVV